MNWTKQQSGSAASISCDTHSSHRSLVRPDEFYITVTRRKPSFKFLGKAVNFTEALAMAEADQKEIENGSKSQKA